MRRTSHQFLRAQLNQWQQTGHSCNIVHRGPLHQGKDIPFDPNGALRLRNGAEGNDPWMSAGLGGAWEQNESLNWPFGSETMP